MDKFQNIPLMTKRQLDSVIAESPAFHRQLRQAPVQFLPQASSRFRYYNETADLYAEREHQEGTARREH